MRLFTVALVKNLLDRIVVLTARPTSPLSGVVIMRLDSIGDFFLWLDSAEQLREIYPGEKLTLLANSTWADLARNLPVFDEVIPVDSKSFLSKLCYRWKMIRLVRRRGFRIAVQTAFSREFFLNDSLMRATGAHHRIGSQGNFSNIRPGLKRISDRWYTKLVAASDEPLCELERNAEFVRGLGVTNYGAQRGQLPNVATLPEELRIAEPYFILFPGASWTGRKWPINNFATLLTTLQVRTGWVGVLCGSRDERELCAAVITASGTHAVNFAGETSLAQFAEVVRGARILIGNETSAVHIAAAVNTPSVCILGGGHYGRFMPYRVGGNSIPVPVVNVLECFGCNWKCIETYETGSPVPCISSITVEQVLKAVSGINVRDSNPSVQ